MSIQPNQTLYIQNLGDKIKKEDLRRLLYQLFSAHGKVLDIVATRAPGMGGQAFVVFKDLQSATAARRKEDGTAFLGKAMRISYAKAKSHAVIKEEEGPEALYLIKMGIHEAKQPKLVVSGAEKANIDADKAKKAGDKRTLEVDSDDEAGPAKKVRVDEEAEMEVDSDEEGPAPAATQAQAPTPQEIPHHILLVENLPAEATDDMLAVLFQQFQGYSTLRYQSAKGTANIVYDSWAQAAEAKSALDGFEMAKGVLIKVTFAVGTQV